MPVVKGNRVAKSRAIKSDGRGKQAGRRKTAPQAAAVAECEDDTFLASEYGEAVGSGGSGLEGLPVPPAVAPHAVNAHSARAEAARGRALPDDIATLPSADRRDDLRIVEARLFASGEPLAEGELALLVSDDTNISALLEELKAFYAGRGINLVRVAGKWAFRTAEDLAFVLEKHTVEERRLSKAALETLAIIAYHQPVTRAEIEDIRGVATSKGTLDVLMETGWIRPRGRRRAPGKPLTYGTTESFLTHFGLEQVGDLPGLTELKGAGLLDATLPPDFRVPEPKELAALMPDELPLEDDFDAGAESDPVVDDFDDDFEADLFDEDAEPGAGDRDGAVAAEDVSGENGRAIVKDEAE